MQRGGELRGRWPQGDRGRVYSAARGAGDTSPPKVSAGCRRAATRASARPCPMLPAPLTPLEPHKARALTTIYAPRKLRTRKNKTAQSRMLENEIPTKPGLSPFSPLPAIGKTRTDQQTKVIVFDLNKTQTLRPATVEDRPIKLHDVKTLTPLRIRNFKRKNSLDSSEEKKPQQLIRENTYDVIEPVFVSASLLQKSDSISNRSQTMILNSENKTNRKLKSEEKVSPKTRFKKAALQVAKLSSLPETGKLLCLRERETLRFCLNEEDQTLCRLENLPESPTEKLNKLSEIFQCLDMKGRHRDKMKKENSWF